MVDAFMVDVDELDLRFAYLEGPKRYDPLEKPETLSLLMFINR